MRAVAVLSKTLLLALALLSAPLAAQDKPLAAYAREVWTTRDGLPHNQVNSIAQTREGYLWFATWEGVVRYNGQEFRSFGRQNVPALRDNGIRSVRVSDSGALVIATSRGGVSVLRGEDWSTYGVAEGLPQNETMVALEDRAGRLWVATENEGLARIADGKATVFGVAQGLPSGVTYTVFEDGNGAIWAGTGDGLVRVEGDRVQRFATEAGLPRGAVFSLVQSADGKLYVGTEEGVYVGQGGRFAPLIPDFPREAVPSLQLDAQGDLWIGTVNLGLMRLGDRGLERFDTSAGLPNNRVASLFADREGSLWVGTNAGLLRFADTPFYTIDSHFGLSDDYVRALLQSDDGDIWIGTSQGLDRWRDGGLLPLAGDAGPSGDAILSLATAREGGLWIGRYSTGLVRWHDGRISDRMTAAEGLPSNQVRALLETPDGALWIGTSRGLLRRQGGTLTRFGRAEGLPRDFVLSLFQSRDGTLWVGTSNGIAAIRGDRVEALDISAYEDAQDVFGMHEDEDGTLWFATDRGLLRLRNGQLRMVSARNGLPVDTLFQVLTDTYGNFWLTSNSGVVHVRREQVEAAADGLRDQIDYQQFAEADGMGSAQCNGGAGPAALRAADGSIWVATARGVAVVQPDELPRYQAAPPPVFIEGLRVDDRSASANGVLVLPPGTRKLELDYVSLSYRTPEQIRYRYRLEGFDNAWVERSHRRNAQYTNLPPGRYRFQVSAAQRGSGWSPETASVNFEIQPRLYQQPWFAPAVVAALVVVLFLLYRASISRLEARERELSALVAQRTRALSDKNGELEKLNDTIRKQAEAFEQQARTDALTGLSNRRGMDESLADAFRDAAIADSPLCFGLLDIDHFKRINDQYSHEVGDRALQRVAEAMVAELGDDAVAHWGGEEFALLFRDTPLDAARGRAEGLRAAIEALDCSDFAPGLRITASIGLVDAGAFASHERMLAGADQHLYEAKHGGRNRVVG